MLSDVEVGRILVVTAHPDDVDFGCAGSVAHWVDAGAEVSYCIVTDGDAGGFDAAVARSEIPGIRRAEQTAAAKAVGVTDLTFLGYPDGRLEVSIDLRRDISRVIRQVRPRRVVMQSAERSYVRIYASHPDLLATGEATICAVYPDSRNPFAHVELLEEEGLEAWTVEEVLVMTANEPDVFIDITDTFDRKIEALLCHVSQHPDPDGLGDRMRGWGGMNAKAGGLPDGRIAEAFRYLSTV
jgi:LmbE family N-acetylglucosaminyl deacetylase